MVERVDVGGVAAGAGDEGAEHKIRGCGAGGGKAVPRRRVGRRRCRAHRRPAA